MKQNIWSIRMLVVVLAALAKAAGADKVPEVVVNADETSVVDGVVVASGHATLTYGTIKISGPRLEYWSDLKLVRCTGPGTVESKGVKTRIEDQTYDLKGDKIVVPKE